MTRPSFNPFLSAADRNTIAKWRRGVAAFYASIALLTLLGLLPLITAARGPKTTW